MGIDDRCSADARPDRSVLEWHYVGGLMLGAYDPPSSVDVADERLARVVEAVIGVRAIDDVWPVDVTRVVETLHELGVLDDLGGVSFLLALMEDWSEREERAQRLGGLLARVQITERLLRIEEDAGEEVLAAGSRYRRARADATSAIDDLMSEVAS